MDRPRDLSLPRPLLERPARRGRWALGLLLALAVLAGACGGSDEIDAGASGDDADQAGSETTGGEPDPDPDSEADRDPEPDEDGAEPDDAGDDPETDDEQDEPDDASDTNPDDGAGDDDDEAPADPGDGSDGAGADYERTEPSPDLISATPAPISEVAVLDDRTLAVRYQNGSEPCSLADVTVDERAAIVEVALVTGLHPNAAAMSCIAVIVQYEIVVELAEPLGDRELVTVQP